MGFTLTNSAYSGNSCGIQIGNSTSGQNNVEVRNGTVIGFWLGVGTFGSASNNSKHRVYQCPS